MLDIKFIRENPKLIKDNCKKRGIKVDIDKLLKLDDERRKIQALLDDRRALRNKTSKGKPSDQDIKRMRKVGNEIKDLESKYAKASVEFMELSLKLPNLTHPEVPIGGEGAYKVIYTNKKPAEFPFPPKDHETLMVKLDLADFERGAKVAASKFYFYKNDLVFLNQALIRFGLDVITVRGYVPVETPDIAKNEILAGIGFNPRGPETQVYSIENTDLSLIGTAEITMGGYHAGEVLDLSGGPKKYVALSHCFRTEAGAYGRMSKGLYRVHQFTKLEMFIYCKPEESEKYHAELLEIEKELCDKLELTYRVIDTASGDLGGPAYRKFDVEAWMTMNARKGKQGDYGEIISTSNCTDYQARRLNIKYRKPDGTLEYVHTLNGTGVALSRFPLAIVEQFQQKDGSIKVPKILRKYLGKSIIK